jgi:hypothetical protein
MSGARIRCVKKIRIEKRLRVANERLRTRALVACSVVLMKTQWPHAIANQNVERSDTAPLDELRRMRTRCAEIHGAPLARRCAPWARVRNSTSRELATSLEVNRETGWRDNKLCLPMRDIFSCLHFIGGYPATSNKRTNGLIRNNKGKAGCQQWGR